MNRCIGVFGALLCACSSSSSSGSGVVAFGVQDCRGQLVEVARLVKTSPLINSIGISNNLSIDGDSLFVAYEGADKTSGLPTAGGIVAVALSGGAPRVVAAPDAAQTFWTTGAFWAAAGQVYLQDGRVLTSVPQDPLTTGTLPPRPASEPLKSAYAHDADFAYAATTTATLTIDNQPGLVVEKTPLAGGAPIVLTAETAGLVELGGMADAGDALLLQVESGKSGVWRIPKDGSPRADVRPDVTWQDPTNFPNWLAWDGENVIGPIWVPINRNGIDTQVLEARVAPDGTSAPTPTKLYGTVATQRRDEVLSLQTLFTRSLTYAQDLDVRLLVASSKGDPTGRVVACGAIAPYGVTPVGIAANDTDVYVSYGDRSDTVIARVTP